MKINWVAPHFHPETGGVETHVAEISRRLIERGHEVTVHASSITVSGEELPLSGELGEIKIKRYRPSINRSFYLSKFKPEITDGDIIAMEGYPSLTNDYVRKKYSGIFPIVIYVQGVVLPLSGFASFQKRVYDILFGIKTLRKAQRIIAMTQLESDWCMKSKISSRRIEIIPNGIPESAFDIYDSGNQKEKHKLKRYLLFIGRMYNEKSPTHLVLALSKLKSEFPDLGVIFAGPDQGEVAAVEAKAKEQGIEDRVVYAGRVSEKEKFELLAGCECLVLPSSFEAQGIVFIEAWAQKKPVIGTRVGGVPYIVKENETGLLYDHGNIDSLAEHIRLILKDPQKAKALGESGFAQADSKFRWKNVIFRIENLYLDVIKEFAGQS